MTVVQVVAFLMILIVAFPPGSITGTSSIDNMSQAVAFCEYTSFFNAEHKHCIADGRSSKTYNRDESCHTSHEAPFLCSIEEDFLPIAASLP